MSFVGNIAPKFFGTAVMPNGAFADIALSQYMNKKNLLLLFYPADFTFVCPTEIVSFSDRIQEFEDLDIQVLGISTDTHFAHAQWRKMSLAEGGIGEIKFPLLSDIKKEISTAYGVLADSGLALRGTFYIDKQQKVQYFMVNNLSFGRNVDEVLRLARAVQESEKTGEVCPANWKAGQKTMTADLKGVADYFVEKGRK